MIKVIIILPLDVGEHVTHEKYGKGVIVGYWAEEIARGSNDVRRSLQSVTYTVNFGGENRNCLSHELGPEAPASSNKLQM
ncbi:MAG TPA: hypothetical protein VF659_19605 [Pyrinomonadaceae bacterium]